MNLTSSSPAIVLPAGLLTLVFTLLKVFNQLTWSWWWILSPLWIMSVVVTLGAATIFTVLYFGTNRR